VVSAAFLLSPADGITLSGKDTEGAITTRWCLWRLPDVCYQKKSVARRFVSNPRGVSATSVTSAFHIHLRRFLNFRKIHYQH
jgi:hypothetical protein